MKVLVSGGTGRVGRYIVEELLGAGYTVTVGGRRAPPRGLFSEPVDFMPLSLDPDVDQIDAFVDAYFFVHTAFSHVAGRYRGGEGDDPAGFHRLNLDGSAHLFETARRAGTRRCVFLSSDAIYGQQPAGTVLHEDMHTRPDTLYGEVKLNAARTLAALSSPSFVTATLTLADVYGDLHPGPWEHLLTDYLAGKAIGPHAGQQVHGRDVGQAVRLMLETEPAKINGGNFNLSDVPADTRTILQHVKTVTGCRHALPAAVDPSTLNPLSTERIRALGWQPGGERLLGETVRRLAQHYVEA